jgi:hypothetical protein
MNTFLARTYAAAFDVVRQPLRLDLSLLTATPDFAPDAFGRPEDRGYIAELALEDAPLLT